MGARYLTELAGWLAADGLQVVEYSGWQTRARGSGGYDSGRPWAIVWHHTASMSDPDRDAAYIATGDEDAPLANLLIDRAGVVWIIAAGATNTNGKGGPWTVSRGTVPADQMNTHAVGVEIANAGTGEPFPAAQLAAAFAVSLSLTSRLGLEPTDALEHVEWAPGRKIDPATADAAAAGGWRPRSINSSGSWSGTDLRAELTRRAGTPTPPQPSPGPTPTPDPIGDHDMALVVALDDIGTAWIGDGITRFALKDPAVFDRYVLVFAGGRLVNTSGAAVRGWPDVQTVDGLVIESLGLERPAG